ncbi:hypothetical protein FNV43_RR09333 [Rhamnella rubrinervis]|uniref:RING-type domain-containing protein n=1 Tax=Rhamnella rubrinervis TaxID=2594499 RepID=A0A8K0HB10_9ROSA|nr:hypothetical protein FNV43_RR09333 [Rhamnella rubrinervis]
MDINLIVWGSYSPAFNINGANLHLRFRQTVLKCHLEKVRDDPLRVFQEFSLPERSTTIFVPSHGLGDTTTCRSHISEILTLGLSAVSIDRLADNVVSLIMRMDTRKGLGFEIHADLEEVTLSFVGGDDHANERAFARITDDNGELGCCSICLDDFAVGELQLMPPYVCLIPCGHVYHENCILRWRLQSKTKRINKKQPLIKALAALARIRDLVQKDPDRAPESTKGRSDIAGAGEVKILMKLRTATSILASTCVVMVMTIRITVTMRRRRSKVAYLERMKDIGEAELLIGEENQGGISQIFHFCVSRANHCGFEWALDSNELR